jgi:membrane-bound serine protease (ClpP class)
MQALAESLWAVLTDPNVAYVLLIVGAWCVVLAASIPGTGLPEGAAALTLALAAVGLTQLPVNLAGLALIGLAVILFVLEFRFMSHGALLLAGSVTLVVGSLLLFRVQNPAQAALSWVTVAAVTLVSTGGFAFFISKGLAVQHQPPAQDPNRVVGTRGVARTDINGQGTVYAAGEEWSASADDKISAGSPVTIVAREGLRLKVVSTGKRSS